MRIIRLDLRAFGPFTDTVLEFDSDCGLHVIFGRNEAGKTSALRAVRQLFFGIPLNSADNFLHDNQQLRIGAALQTGDGRTLECIRRKGRANTLRAADDNTPLEPELLQQCLGGLSETLFEQMFGIDHDALVRGGREIVEGKGEIGQILFAAGAGISNLREVQRQLDLEADALYKSRGSNPQINARLAELRTAREIFKEAQLPSKTWVEHDQKLREAVARRQSVEQELQSLKVRREQLRRLHDALPAIATRKRLLAELAALADAPILRKDFAAKRAEAQVKLKQAEIAERQSRAALAELGAALAKIDLPRTVLEHAERIEQLQQELGSHQKAQRDRPQLEAQARQLMAQADSTLRSIWPERSMDDVAGLRLTAAEQARISTLGMREESLAKAVRETRARLADIRRQMEQAQSALAGLPPPRPAAELRKSLDRAKQQGPLEAQWSQSTAQLQSLQREAELSLARLGLWTGTLDQAERLPAPPLEAIDSFVDRAQSAEADLKGLQSRLSEEEAASIETDAQITSLRLAQDALTEDDLAEARAKRDTGWRLVEQAWRNGKTDAKAEKAFIAEFAPAGELARAYAAAVERADHVADRLRREAHRVANLAQLLARQQQHAQRREQLAAQVRAAQTEVEAVDLRWAELWQPAGIAPHHPREMRPWRQQFSAILDQAGQCRELQATVDRLSERISAARQELASRLQELGDPAEGESLAALIERCEEVLADIEASEAARSEVERDLVRLASELPVAEQQADAAEADLAAWRAQWTAAVERLGLAADATAAEANAVLKGLGDLFQTLDQAGAIRQRISDIDRDAQGFAEHVRAFVKQVAPELGGASAESTASELNTRLKQARAAEQQAAHLAERREKEAELLRAAVQTIEAMQAQLSAYCAEARCPTVDALPAAEERSARKQELQKQLEVIEQQLTVLAAGLPVEELVARADQVEADRLKLDLDATSEQLQTLEAEKDRLAGVIGSQQTLLSQMDGSAKAAEAAENAQSLLASLRSHVEQYARTRLASAVLRRAIERYRERNQDPVLRRAGELFAELTLGAFESLRPEIEKGDPVVVGVRAGTGEHVGVECMSEGTADQLYLALRLASLERYLDHNEPVPFVVDDILVQFDNERSAATLRTLAQLARRTQVIFFTHHEHLLDLAAQHLSDEEWSVQRLPPRQPAVAGVS